MKECLRHKAATGSVVTPQLLQCLIDTRPVCDGFQSEGLDSVCVNVQDLHSHPEAVTICQAKLNDPSSTNNKAIICICIFK